MEEERLISLINNPEKLNELSLDEVEQLTKDYPYFQAAWVLYLLYLNKTNHPEFKNKLGQISIRLADRKNFYSLLNTEKEGFQPLISELQSSEIYKLDELKSKENIKAQNDLISNFIASQPSIEIKQGGEHSSLNYDISEKSVVENEEIITETFANILAQQKKYDKAIEVFKKLSLKFPEKSIYFAGRIEEIEILKNN